MNLCERTVISEIKKEKRKEKKGRLRKERIMKEKKE